MQFFFSSEIQVSLTLLGLKTDLYLGVTTRVDVLRLGSQVRKFGNQWCR